MYVRKLKWKESNSMPHILRDDMGRKSTIEIAIQGDVTTQPERCK